MNKNYFLILCAALLIYSKSVGQGNHVDSLKAQLKTNIHDTTRTFLLNAIATEYSKKSEHEQCIRITGETLLLIERLIKKYSEKSILKKLTIEKAVSYNLLGISSHRLGNYAEALENYKKSLEAYSQINNQKKVAVALSNIGVTFYAQGNYPKALEYYFNSLKIRERISDKPGIAAVMCNIGSVYEPLLDFAKSIEYQNKALKIARETGDFLTEANCLNNLGKVYWHQRNYTKAIDYFSSSLKLYDSVGDLSGKSAALGNMGVIYCEQKDFGKALEYCRKAMEIQKYTGNKRGVAVSLDNLGNIYYKQKQFSKAIGFFNQSLVIARQTGILELISDMESNLYQCYEQLGDYKKAFVHLKNYNIAIDSLFNKEKNEQVIRLQNTFEIERREQKINLLEKNKRIKEIELSKNQQEISWQKKSSSLLITVCVLLLLLLAGIVFVSVKKAQTQRLLASKNEEIHRQKIAELLKEQNLKAKQQLIKGQETERQRIAKDLHDGVGGTLAGIKLKLIRLEETMAANREIKTLVENVESVYDEIRTISHNLTPPQLQQSAFTDAIHHLVSELETNSHLKIKLECVAPEEINNLHENIQIEIYRILQELLKNVLLHASASEVIVDLIKSDNELTLLVEDNGKGYVAPAKTQGIGLNNIKHRVESLKGTFSVDSKISRGTAVNINIVC